MNPWDSFCPGRLDQHLYPFYKKGLDEGTLTREQAEELLQCFWIKFNNQPAPPKVGVTAAESGTYTDFAQINSGGLKEDGSDGVNDVTFLILDVIEEMRLVQPSSSIQVSKKNPDRFHQAGGPDHPHRLRPALGLQHRPDRPGTDPHGQVRRRRPQRRLQRLRRGRRLRQGSLHPDRLLQPAQGAGADPEQRRGSQNRQAESASRPATPSSSAASSSSSKPTAGSSTT